MIGEVNVRTDHADHLRFLGVLSLETGGYTRAFWTCPGRVANAVEHETRGEDDNRNHGDDAPCEAALQDGLCVAQESGEGEESKGDGRVLVPVDGGFERDRHWGVGIEMLSEGKRIKSSGVKRSAIQRVTRFYRDIHWENSYFDGPVFPLASWRGPSVAGYIMTTGAVARLS